jgi:eukaryotic-like serine/threonine-protein kinase
MTLSMAGRTWDQASSPSATRLARQFEAAWRASGAGQARPDPLAFVPDESDCRNGDRLALLRTELTLLWEDGRKLPVEEYLKRFPDLDDETCVALIYEEFCLREEDSDAPVPAEYFARFPTYTERLRRVFDIHHLVGSAKSTSLVAPSSSSPPLPEMGQTIAGFRLVEELGRGAFARVFRAQEQTLADRPVALKVSRTGSREPQALGRLQHTHIVPVHSYQTDSETGLHLLCMPYFGRVTLARVLADPKVRVATTGAEIVSALDRLDPAGGLLSERPAGRIAMGRRSYARAIAWWGARLAEALQHAHERGVLHRDVKPSNVLITGDGMPMVLDFNLAWDPWLQEDGEAPSSLGGTLAYMAPEHLEGLADGVVDKVDARSDIYSLGIVLFEALGTRPFPQQAGAASVTDALMRAAEQRRKPPPKLRTTYPEVPPELEAVIQKCLAPDPNDRYARASDLAEDLQAVADDGPVRFAREPVVNRGLRWIRRHRKRLVIALPVLFVVGFGSAMYLELRQEKVRNRAHVQSLITEGKGSLKTGDFDLAVSQLEFASRAAKGDPALADLYKNAREQFNLAKQRRDAHAKVASFHLLVEDLRVRLLDPGVSSEKVYEAVEDALKPFYVFANSDWTRLQEWAVLETSDRNALFDEVDELLFLWTVTLDRASGSGEQWIKQGLMNCSKAPGLAGGSGPWRALLAKFEALRDGREPEPVAEPSPGSLSAQECFQWGLLRQNEGKTPDAIAWLQRAASRQPDKYWYQFYLAYVFDRAGQVGPALNHYGAAIALNPKREWPYYNRGRLLQSQGANARALEDLKHAVELAGEHGFPEARLEEGLALQALGDLSGARHAYESIPLGAGAIARAARLNRSRLDVESGDYAKALSEYDALIAEWPDDSQARLARAQLALRVGKPSKAEEDLSILLRSPGSPQLGSDRAQRAEVFAYRARARLALAWPKGALEDADQAMALEPDPSRERLRLRALLAAQRTDEIRIDRPDVIDLLPFGGISLATDLRTAVERMRPARDAEISPESIGALLTRSVLLAALGDSASAEADASRVIERAPSSPLARLVRGRVRLRGGDLPGALEDAEHALNLDANDPRPLELRGVVRLAMGQPEASLPDLDRALRKGGDGPARAAKAQALLALKQPWLALEEWNLALRYDHEDPRAYLGRARAFVSLKHWDHATADLESAAGWASDRPPLLAEVVSLYRQCLAARPDRLARVDELDRRAKLGTAKIKN